MKDFIKGLKLILNIVIITFVPWILYSGSDAIYEYVSLYTGELLQNTFMVGVPIVTVIAGCVLFFVSKEPDKCKISHILTFGASVLILDALLTWFIIKAIDNNFWIIEQRRGTLFNGIEYIANGIMQFAAFIVIIIFMLLYKLVSYLKNRKRQ